MSENTPSINDVVKKARTKADLWAIVHNEKLDTDGKTVKDFTRAELEQFIINNLSEQKESDKMSNDNGNTPVVIGENNEATDALQLMIQQQLEQVANSQNGRLSIKQTATYLGVTTERVRGLVRTKTDEEGNVTEEARVDSDLFPVAEGSSISRHMITLDSIKAYVANKGKKSGAKYHIIKVTAEQATLITEWVNSQAWGKDIEPLTPRYTG